MAEKGYNYLVPDCQLAMKLTNSKKGEEFEVNEYKYRLEEINYYEI